MPRSMGRAGAGACRIFSHFAQLIFGRTCRTTLKRAGMRSKISVTSSPMIRSAPPQSGQVQSGLTGASCTIDSRGR